MRKPPYILCTKPRIAKSFSGIDDALGRRYRWGWQACHPTDEELDDSLGSITIAVGIGAASHLLVASRVVKERTNRSDNRLWVRAREAGGAGSDCFGAF